MEEGSIQKKFRFIELDLESVVKKKIKKITHSKKLASLFQKLNLEPVVSCKKVAYLEHQHLFTLGNDYGLTVCDLSNVNDFKRIID